MGLAVIQHSAGWVTFHTEARGISKPNHTFTEKSDPRACFGSLLGHLGKDFGCISVDAGGHEA